MQHSEKHKNRSRRRKTVRLFVPLLAVLIFVGTIHLLLPDAENSVTENRPLQQLPDLTSFSPEEATDWYSDQFPGRNTMFHAGYLLRKWSGQREINNVFLGKGALLMQNDLADESHMEELADAINGFEKTSGLPTAVFIAPSAADAQPQKLPFMAPVLDQQPLLDHFRDRLSASIEHPDLLPEMQEYRDEYLYYRTDHHWTTLGAGIAAETIGHVLGHSVSLSDFSLLPVSDDFQGTLASRTGSVGLKDSISIAKPQKDVKYVVRWNDGSLTSSMYDMEALDRKDQYELFLGPNQGVIHIETEADNRDNLLIFKDSYANSLIQYLIPVYRSITIIDPRYFYDDLSAVLSSYSITETAFIYSSDTLMTDTSLKDVLASAASQSATDADTEKEESGATADGSETETATTE